MLANIKFKAIEDLKKLRANSGSDDDFYNECLKNKSVYDEDGNFLPYSTIINTLEQHIALCSALKKNNQ